MKRLFQILAFGLAVCAFNAQAAEIVVSQKNKDFSQKHVKLKVGDSISFRNDDPFFHNVFSLSDTTSFDLGSYPQGQSKSVKFTKAGTVEIECSIHPNMKLVVEVQ
jgi:plastocyanin